MRAWRVKTQCDNCPFASRGKGLKLRRSLAPGRWAEILSGLRQGESFSCHKTTEHDDEGEVIDNGLMCAGAIAWQAKHGASSNLQRVMERLDYFSRQRKEKVQAGVSRGDS